MRLALICLMSVAFAAQAAELPYVTLTLGDGRRLTGLYDAGAGTLDLFARGTDKIKIEPGEIVGNVPAERPAPPSGGSSTSPLPGSGTADAKSTKPDTAALEAALAIQREVQADCERKLVTTKANALRLAKQFQDKAKMEHQTYELRRILLDPLKLPSATQNDAAMAACDEVQKLIFKRNQAKAAQNLLLSVEDQRGAVDFILAK